LDSCFEELVTLKVPFTWMMKGIIFAFAVTYDTVHPGLSEALYKSALPESVSSVLEEGYY
jgi:hypothetical protein